LLHTQIRPLRHLRTRVFGIGEQQRVLERAGCVGSQFHVLMKGIMKKLLLSTLAILALSGAVLFATQIRPLQNHRTRVFGLGEQ